MARMATAESIGTVVVTPHQLGNYSHNQGDEIRALTLRMQQLLAERQIPLQVFPGADVRVDAEMIERIRRGDVLTLADQQKHVLLELPHELYFPLGPVIKSLEVIGITSVLSHPERNQGLLKEPRIVSELTEQGCLMQVTAGSITGQFGPACQQFSEWMLQRDLVHFISTDAHGSRSRRPLMLGAFQRTAELTDEQTAQDLCCRNPLCVVKGRPVAVDRSRKGRRGLRRWLVWRRAG